MQTLGIGIRGMTSAACATRVDEQLQSGLRGAQMELALQPVLSRRDPG